jgi:hypothetical protein
MEDRSCETVEENRSKATGTRVEEVTPRGVRLEASEFESMLQRAREILNIREQAPPKERRH